MNMHAAMTSFVPAANTSKQLRNAFSRFATGVTVVTTMTDQGPVGMTVNSFSSVSLEPPLTLWSIENTSHRFDAFTQGHDTAIHVLAHDQEALCLAFARDPEAFDQASWHEGANGVPLLDGCLARFECRRHAMHEAGDHTILIDQIMQATVWDGEPLIFFRGQFSGLVDS